MDDRAGARRTDRQLGWLMSLGGVLLVVSEIGHAHSIWGEYARWWNLGGVLVAVTIVLFAVAGRALPYGLLRAGWIGAPLLGALLQLTTYAAYRTTEPPATLAWPWALEPVLVSYLVLWLRPWAAVAGAVLSGTLTAISALVWLGEVPPVVAVATPVHVSNLAFVVIFIGIRARVNRLRDAEAQAHEQVARRVRAQAEAQRQIHLHGLIHDEVLSVLTTAMGVRTDGTPSGPLRAEATHALQLFDVPPEVGPGVGPGDLDAAQALSRLTAAVRRIDPLCRVHAHAQDGTVPELPVHTIAAAASEAIRNSLRHAGPQATRMLEVRIAPTLIRVRVVDDGTGFDTGQVHPTRMGVRDSITGRMDGLEGGMATINSRPGAGVEVVLSWRT